MRETMHGESFAAGFQASALTAACRDMCELGTLNRRSLHELEGMPIAAIEITKWPG